MHFHVHVYQTVLWLLYLLVLDDYFLSKTFFQNIINIVVPVWLSLLSYGIVSSVLVPPGAWNVYVMIVTKKSLSLLKLFPTVGSRVERSQVSRLHKLQYTKRKIGESWHTG